MGSKGDDDALYLCEVCGITVGVGAVLTYWVGYE